MVDIPAVCSSCGALFVAPNLIGGSGRVVFQNSRISPCPACGGTGDIFDGIYDAATQTARLLISASTNPNQLKILKDILQSASDKNLSYRQIKTDVEKKVPELQSLSDCLPKTRSELYAFIAIVLTIIGMVSAGAHTLSKSDQDVPESEVEKIVEEAIREKLLTASRPKVTAKTKVGRNDPCPCGSGVKFKKCCLLKK